MSDAGLQVLGIIISVIGFALVFGNITGLFPTFPYAGFIVSSLGVLILKGVVGQESKPEAGKAPLPIYRINQTTAELFGVLQCPECGSSEHVVMLFAAIGSGTVKARCDSCGKEFTSVLSQEKTANLRKLASIIDKD